MSQRPIRSVIDKQHIVTALATTTVIDAGRLMKQSKVGAVLVVDNGRLVGIFTERDALYRVLVEGLDPTTTQIAEVMTARPQTIHPDKPFVHALHLMHEGGFRHMPVVEGGRPVGIVSARDVLGPELEELVSELRQMQHIGEIMG